MIEPRMKTFEFKVDIWSCADRPAVRSQVIRFFSQQIFEGAVETSKWVRDPLRLNSLPEVEHLFATET